MSKRLFEECSTCGGSGFSGYGTDYGDVCSECGGQRFLPVNLSHSPEIIREAANLVMELDMFSPDVRREILLRALDLEEVGSVDD